MSEIVSDLYRPLPGIDEIRLLKLSPSDDNTITGTLESYSLQSVPNFYALSYCWGKPKKDALIIIDGHELAITRSLASALAQLIAGNHLSNSPRSHYIWVDQICVNQLDHGERRHQVTLMGPIYSNALRTLIWLGDDTNNIAEAAFNLCSKIESIYEKECQTDGIGRRYISPSIFALTDLDEYGLPKRNHESWKAIFELFSNQWFCRLWVQQEAILSNEDPTVIFGQAACSFLTVARSYEWLAARDFEYMRMIPKQGENIGLLFRNREARGLGISKDLSTMVQHAGYSTHSTDPRDKVYGLLGVAINGLERNTETGTRIRVDISAEYTVDKTYRDTTRHILVTSKCLAILAGPKLRTKHIEDRWRSFGRQRQWRYAPSWVRSFDFGWHPRTSLVAEKLVLYEDDHKIAALAWKGDCQACKTFEAQIEHPTSNPDVLRLRGLLVDTVIHTEATMTAITTGLELFGRNQYFNYRSIVAEHARYCKALAHHYGLKDASYYLGTTLQTSLKSPSCLRFWEAALKLTTRSPPDLAVALFTILTRRRGANDIPLSRDNEPWFFSWLHMRYAESKFRRLRAPGLARAIDFLQQWPLDNIDIENTKALLNLCAAPWTEGRRFFVTAAGRLGLGPPAMREGDRLAVLFGGGAPFVLRRHNDIWLLVGEAYVEGYMAGEAIDSWQDGQLEAQWFDIH